MLLEFTLGFYLFQCVFYLYPKFYIICLQLFILYVCVTQRFEVISIRGNCVTSRKTRQIQSFGERRIIKYIALFNLKYSDM